jgi:biopolymer transport protein ExbD
VRFLRANDSAMATVSLTPLVDIIFLLIIFFLVSSTFEKGEKKLGIELPQTKGGDPQSDQKPESWVIMIDKDGHFFWNDESLSAKELEMRLRRNQGRKDRVQVVIKADGRVEYASIAKVMGQLSEFEYKKLAFKTIELKE